MQIDDPCGIGRALNVFEGRWKGAIVWWLASEPRRFGALRRLLDGVTARVLTNQLRGLERDGIVTRSVEEGPVTQVEYALTDLGRALRPLLEHVAQWGQQHAPAIEEARARYEATRSTEPR